MKNKITLSLVLLLVLSIACTNTAAIVQPVPTLSSNPSQKLDTIAQLIVTAEIGVQVRSACGVNNPTTGIILTRGEKVTPTGAAVVLPDMSRWQPITQGCVNADYLGPVK